AESLLQEEGAPRRFEQEARTLASLSHPNILTIYDIVTDSSGFYVVMEMLRGENLRERLKSGSISLQDAMQIAMGIAEGLAAAHANGIIHRDLKPENVFLTEDHRIKILDFGLARVLPKSVRGESWMETTPDLSRPGMVVGTLRSMPP